MAFRYGAIFTTVKVQWDLVETFDCSPQHLRRRLTSSTGYLLTFMNTCGDLLFCALVFSDMSACASQCVCMYLSVSVFPVHN